MEIFIMVRDTGIGIAKADQDKLFKSFSQVDASISRKYGGTGLGLNICKQLVELMGGSIHMESESGKGSVFSFDIWVELPEEECGEDKLNNEYSGSTTDKVLVDKLRYLSEALDSEDVFTYGTKENREEIEKKMSKLILCMDMESWEKAEMFAEAIKQLVAEAPREVQSAGLRLKMAVQKGDYEKAIEAYEKFKERSCENIDS